ncbi:MAG: NUDIX hydrolase [Prevotella sp.]|nr:NUDIX hydrolase [Prevotella sp.]
MKQRTDEEMAWKILSSETVIERPWLTARRDRVLLPTGKIHPEYYVLHYPDWVNIIAETTDGRLILERQYRHALGIVSTEICAGIAEEGETPLEAAKRELQEETGYTGGDWQLLMKMAPNPSSNDNYSYSFLARGVVKSSERHLDETEDIDVSLHTKREVYRMLCDGKFLQALMIAPLWKYFATIVPPEEIR